jgi:hypothetical protein
MIAMHTATRFACSSLVVLAISALAPASAAAQEHDPLLTVVRGATERFRDPAAAQGEGYGLMFGCVSGDEAGAMGLHYVNGALIGDDVLDPTRPEIVIYEKMPDGSLKLVGADFLVFKDVWDATHAAPPQLMGQLLHLFEAPNRFGLPAFYTLHVWAWKHNPNGTFVNWHPHVSCDAFVDDGGVPPDPGPDGLATWLKRKQ